MRTRHSPRLSTTTKVDMLGRVVSYTDAHNSTTGYTYDQAGHQVTQESPSWGDYRANVFNTSGQLIAQHGGHTSSPPKLAEATYSPTTGELTSVNYPGGTANAGNNTTATFSYDTSTGLPTTVSYNVNSGGLTVSDTQTYSRTGRVLSAIQAQAGSATSTASSSYSYDAVGRLTFASVPGKTLSYSFGSTNTGACSGYSGINTNAGKNTNRTSVSDSVLGTRYYCYDNADRLIATSDATYSSMFGKDTSGNSTAYDDRGNTVSSDSTRAMVYDLTNRHEWLPHQLEQPRAVGSGQKTRGSSGSWMPHFDRSAEARSRVHRLLFVPRRVPCLDGGDSSRKPVSPPYLFPLVSFACWKSIISVNRFCRCRSGSHRGGPARVTSTRARAA